MVGKVVGRYRIVDKIAEGGMGVVYRAQHTLLAERWAAIKFLRRSLSSEQEAVDRFFIEARAAASIGHAGIVEIFDFGYDEDNNVYLIMEYLEGETLKKRLRAQGILPTPEATALVRGVAGALEHAHAKNIIHRDLKPENIFLVKEPEFPGGLRPKVLDFGLAKLLEERGSGHTRTGIMLGTPTYMSPEQCAGSRTIDHRSDLYSLGCIFYELVCGRPPFVSDSVGGLIGAHMYAEVPSLHRWNETIHPVLEEVIITMLAKDPGNRFQSMGELRETLERAFPEELADEATERLVAGESSSGGVSLRDLWMSELASAGAARSNTDGLATQSLDIDILDIEDDDSGSYTDALRPREWLSELGPEPGARPPRSSSAPRRPAPSPGRASPMPPPRPPPAPRPREGARAVGPPVTIETRAVPPSPPMASNSPGARPREPEPAAKESPANGPLGSVQLSTLRGSAGEQASNRPAPAEAPMPSRHPEGPPRWSPAPALAGRRLSARSWSIGLGLMIVAAAVAALVLDAGSERSVSMSGEGRAADAGATRAVAVAPVDAASEVVDGGERASKPPAAPVPGARPEGGALSASEPESASEPAPGRTEPKPESGRRTEVAPVPAPAPARERKPKRRGPVELYVRVSPRGVPARIEVDGAVVTRQPIVLERRDKAYVVRVSAPGHRRETLRVRTRDAGRDGKLRRRVRLKGIDLGL